MGSLAEDCNNIFKPVDKHIDIYEDTDFSNHI